LNIGDKQKSELILSPPQRPLYISKKRKREHGERKRECGDLPSLCAFFPSVQSRHDGRRSLQRREELIRALAF